MPRTSRSKAMFEEQTTQEVGLSPVGDNPCYDSKSAITPPSRKLNLGRASRAPAAVTGKATRAAGRIAESDLKALKHGADLVALVRGSGVALAPAGAEQHVGRCPFHGDGTPSFYVYNEAGDRHYHCYGCGAHGDALDYLQAAYRLSFRDAVRRLAGDGAMPDAAQVRKAEEEHGRMKRAKAEADAKRANDLWNEAEPLTSSELVAHYLGARGLQIPAGDVLRFHYQFSFDGESHVPAILAPVRDGMGEIVGLSRIDVRDNPERKRSFHGTVSGFSVRLGAEPNGRVAYVEGVEDGLALIQMGVEASVRCALSAGSLAKQALPKGVREVAVYADVDPPEAGKPHGISIYNAEKMAQNFAKLGANVSILVPDMDGAKDPNDALKAGAGFKVWAGADAIEQEQNAEAEAVEHEHEHEAEEVEPDTSEAPGQSDEELPAINPPVEAEGEFDLTEDGLALEMGAGLEATTRYVHAWGRWLFWDGSKWETDEKLKHYTLTRQFLRHKGDEVVAWAETKAAKLAEEAGGGEIDVVGPEDSEERRKWEKDNERRAKAATKAEKLVNRMKAVARELKNKKRVENVASLARSNSELVGTVDQWDRDLWTINTPAGIVDLRTGELLPADPLAYCTKSTAVEPAPAGTRAPVWEAFLARTYAHDPELIPFVQRFLGYSTTGSTREHALAFAWGEGGNGKGVLLNTAMGILGDYAQPAGLDTFLASNNERHPTDMAGMRGARMVVASEVSAGKAWDEAKVKALTGGDKIRARFMRQDEFSFDPQFTLWVSGNHQPRIKSADEAMRRRLHLIPFTQNIPEQERDPNLTDKLKAEWPAILRWMVDGAVAWAREGLNPPASVREASAAYMDREDDFGSWLKERCVLSNRIEFTPLSDLYASYREWREANGLPVETTRALSGRLAEKGLHRIRRTEGIGFAGIKLATVDVDDQGRPVAPPSWATSERGKVIDLNVARR